MLTPEANNSENQLSPRLKLFLSVDIWESTQYKTDSHLHKMFESVQKQEKFLKDFVSSNSLSFEESKEIIEQAALKTVSLEDDWGYKIQSTFTNFHTEFERDLGAVDLECKLWKVLGDELIYQCEITEGNKLHDYVGTFSRVLRTLDHRLKKAKSFRLKGSAWVAEFPIRNRIIKLPPAMSMNIQEDYIGPDIDIGFRIGKVSWPGFITTSMNLVYLLGKYSSKRQIEIAWVGWKQLKGVWGGLSYPILWSKLKDNTIDYAEYTPVEVGGNEYLRKAKRKNFKEARQYIKMIDNIIANLPHDLGVIYPFIPSELESSDSEELIMYKKQINILQTLGEQKKEEDNPEGSAVKQKEARDDQSISKSYEQIIKTNEEYFNQTTNKGKR